MPYVPLTVGWMNTASNTSIYSSRIAFGLSLPQPYADAEYSYIKGTGYNTTHWTLTVRCKGCSQWHDVDGNLVSIDANASAQKFAYGLSSKPSTFNVHSSFGNYRIDLTQGQNADFDELVAANLVENVPPVSSSVSIPSSTISLRPTTMSTSTTSSGLSEPTSTGVPLGITAHSVTPNGCLTSSKTLIPQRNLNHGIALSHDGKTLYASSATSVFSWTYDANTMSVSGNSTTILTGMDSRGHVTRTLSIPPQHPNLLIVSHGSNDNFDYGSADMKTGRSCVKVFDTTTVPENGYDYSTGGYQMGYGLRNEVGLAFDAEGMLWGVENSSDELHRTIDGVSVDIHTDSKCPCMNCI